MKQMMRKWAIEGRFFRFLFAVVILLMTALLAAVTVNAQEETATNFNNLDDKGVILDGYDPVAFFTDNKPVKGNPNFNRYTRALFTISPVLIISSCLKAIRKNTSRSLADGVLMQFRWAR